MTSKPLKSGDKVILRIGSDSYDEVVTSVSKAGIVTCDNKRFKEIKIEGELNGRLYFRGMGDSEHYRLVDNRDSKIKPYIDAGF